VLPFPPHLISDRFIDSEYTYAYYTIVMAPLGSAESGKARIQSGDFQAGNYICIFIFIFIYINGAKRIFCRSIHKIKSCIYQLFTPDFPGLKFPVGG
jgi:hypothetical protein